jgi:UTP-glucose-1-phosphate uridylyltransferase/mevalonate kinase
MERSASNDRFPARMTMNIFVPGRICLFGEHSDWAGGYRRINADVEKGYTLICGTNQGIYARVEPHPTALVLSSTTPDGRTVGPREIPLEPAALLEEAQQGGFFSYAAGVAYQVLTHYRVRGLVIENTRTDLPIRKGLSSSAAICVLTARAFNRVYDLKLTVRGEMELAYQGEITTPSRCGRMDQGCAYGDRAVLMEFDGDRLSTKEVRPAHDLHFVIVDLNAGKNTLEILKRLNRSYPFPEGPLERGVQDLLGSINKRIVGEAREALEAGDAERLGTLMAEAQAFFDRYAAPACPEELTAPVLHKVLGHEPLRPHIWGGKGVGSQGDGTAQFLARGPSDQRAVVEILQRDLGLTGLTLTLGTGPKVRRALIPAAGFGTRLFPASKATKKELFPVVDRDGIAKPAILLIVEEALEAGIEEVVIVVQEEDLDDFRSFFNTQISIENYNKLSRAAQEYARRILDIGQRIRFVTQSAQEGLGHAVYCGKAAIGPEPFLLMLGDHLYRSTGSASCARQVVEAYQQSGTSVLGLRPTPESEIGSFGVATGVWTEANRRLTVTEFAEKPTADYARTHLRVQGLPEGEYLTVFGQYVIKPLIFDYLEEHIRHNVRERGEFQLTSALDRLRQEDGFQGLIVDGRRFDIGLPRYYLETLATFSKD